jgi:two-component system chemotaxis sensor kinase CheA
LLDAQSACDAATPPKKNQPVAPISTSAAAEDEGGAPKNAAAESKATKREEPLAVGEDLRRRVAAVIREEDLGDILVGRIVFEPDLALVGMKARLVYSRLSNVGAIRFFDPPLEDIENREHIDALCFGVAGERSPEQLRSVLRIAGIQEMLIEPLEQRRSPAKTPMQGRGNASEPGAKPAETLRVDIERLDHMMNLAGQLAISKARVAQIAKELRPAVDGRCSPQSLRRMATELKKMTSGTTAYRSGADPCAEVEAFRDIARRLQTHVEMVCREMESVVQARSSVNDLFETIHQLDSVSDSIRQTVMDMRMLPIGPLFTRFHRAIREIARANGKDICLTIRGEKTELDKRMIDELGDPMIHLIRNAADHGIESPDDRAAAGKPRQGTIALDAFHRGSNIVIRVSDDGKGLNADRIRARAVEKGLVSSADAELMTCQQIHQLIWLPGLSTAEKVTDISGRGVGMDIVRSKITELSGVVEVKSEPGRGTAFEIKLPLTLAVFPSLMVETDGDVFAVPLTSVAEIVRVRRRDISAVCGQWAVPIRDHVVAILTLGGVFRWNHRNGTNDDDTVTLVIVGENKRQLGLVVDRVLGEEDVVIKSIANNYHDLAGIAGATILGDGRVSLILDPPALIEMSSHPVVTTTDT